MNPEQRFANLYGFEVPAPPQPRGAYRAAVIHGDVLYVSGQTPRVGSEPRFQGRLGHDMGVDEGRAAARLALANALAAVRGEIGDLARIEHVIQLVGYVQCVPEFTQQTEVVDGASAALLEVLGEAGRHARTAVGVTSLPRGVAVELALQVAVRTR